jgi:dihydrofolate reductase
MDKTSWKNTRLAKGDLTNEINRLKRTKGRDIIAYGGISFLTSLIKAGLVDEYNLFINPVILGSGLSIFHNPENDLKLDLVYSTSFECGITALCYIQHKSIENSHSMTFTADSASSI